MARPIPTATACAAFVRRRPGLLATALVCGLALAACKREEASPAATTDDAAAAEPEAALRSQVGDLMQGEGLRPTNPSVALDTRPLAGQAELGVRSLLGNPTGCEDVPKGRACRYAQAATEITYIDGMADWIVVGDLGDAPFSAAALARVGLPTTDDPIESTPQFIRWQNLAGYREVTLHAGPGGRAARIEMKMATL